MAFTRYTARQEENRRKQELVEKTMFLLYGLGVVIACFFVPLTTAIILVSLYGLSIFVFTIFKEEIMNKSFRILDRIASFFGYPPPPELPIIEFESLRIDRSLIQRRLRSLSEPAINELIRMREQNQLNHIRSLWHQVEQKAALQEMKPILANKALQRSMYFQI